MNPSRSVRPDSENTCSKLKITLNRLDLSKLRTQDIEALLNISENKCPDDTYYLHKLYDMIVSFDETLMDKAVGFKNNFDDFNNLQRMLIRDMKNLKLQNKKLEDERNSLAGQVKECKSRVEMKKKEPRKKWDLTTAQKDLEILKSNVAHIKTPPFSPSSQNEYPEEEIEEIQMPPTARGSPRQKMKVRQSSKRNKRPWY